MAPKTDYPVGTLKFHPQYPVTPTIAMRTVYSDDDGGVSSWQTLNGGGLGTHFVRATDVANWPLEDPKYVEPVAEEPVEPVVDPTPPPA